MSIQPTSIVPMRYLPTAQEASYNNDVYPGTYVSSQNKFHAVLLEPHTLAEKHMAEGLMALSDANREAFNSVKCQLDRIETGLAKKRSWLG